MPDRALTPDHPPWASERLLGMACLHGRAASYLLASWVLRAGGSGAQPLARKLPHGIHRTGADVTLRVSQKLLGELRHL